MRIVKDHNETRFIPNCEEEFNPFDLDFALKVLIKEGNFTQQEIAAAQRRRQRQKKQKQK
jgi:hypothetical protein